MTQYGRHSSGEQHLCVYGDRHSPWKWWTMKAKLTGTGDNRDVAQQAEDLWAEERTVPNVEKFVEKSL